MDFLYSRIFFGLLNNNREAHEKRSFRFMIAIIVTIVFITGIVSMGLYAIGASGEHVEKRIISAILAMLCLRYYSHLASSVFK